MAQEEVNKAEDVINKIYYRFSSNPDHVVKLTKSELEELRVATSILYKYFNPLDHEQTK